MSNKEILTAVIVDAQRAGLSGRAFAEYLAGRLELAGAVIGRAAALRLLLEAPSVDNSENVLRTAIETIRIRYMAANGMEKAVLGDVLKLLEDGYGKEPCF